MRLAAIPFLLLGLVWSSGCSDGGGKAGTGPSNHPPVIEFQADTSMALGDTLVLWARAHDVDGDELTYIAAAHITYEEFTRGYYPDAGIHQKSGRFRFRARIEDRPQRGFTFYADDGHGGVDSTTFRIRVS